MLGYNGPLVERESDFNRRPFRDGKVAQNKLDVDGVRDLKLLGRQEAAFLGHSSHVAYRLRGRRDEPFAGDGGSLTLLLVGDQIFPGSRHVSGGGGK